MKTTRLAPFWFLIGLALWGTERCRGAAPSVPPAMPPSLVTLTNVVATADGLLQLQVLGPAGMVYSLQVSRNLQTWRTVDFLPAPSGSAAFQDAAAAGASERFYRVRLEFGQPAIQTVNYQGWSNSLLLANGQAEVAVVPAVGRIMQFRFKSEPDGPFWENEAMFGKPPTAQSWNTTGSFGGDKVWPSPQSVWSWPPPRGFDSMPFTAAVTNGEVILTGPVDTRFGSRVVRHLRLHPAEAILRVTSAIEKTAGGTNEMGVWVITQTKEAERVFLPIPKQTAFPKGYTDLGAIPQGLTVTNGFVSLSRDRKTGTKIGNDAGALLWVGTNDVLLIESPRRPAQEGTRYPDKGSSAEVYTNPDPVPYIELELLGPLAKMGTNHVLQATSVYSLFHRTQSSPLAEAASLLAP